MAYRIYRRESVRKGKFYFAVSCKNCKEEVVILDDKSNGSQPFGVGVKFDGDMSTTCPQCFHDDLYNPQLIFSTQAAKNIPSSYPERAEISKSPRKPISRTYPNAAVTMGVGYIEDRPKAAALVGRIVTSWADIEVQCARLLAELMGTNIPAAAAVFGSIRNSRSQHDALRAAAETVLNQKDLILFNAYIKRKEVLEKERNYLAHGCFGVSISIPDHIVWVAQSDFLAFTAAHKANDKPFDLRSKQFVYELGTLERIAQEISEFYTQIGFFTGYLVARHSGPEGEAFRVTRYSELCEQHHIKPALAVLKKQLKKR
jgi:hypothetical protein